jgi:hypothetical protein
MLLLLIATALAGDLDFNPDRPGIGDSTTTVGAGRVMIEAGAMLTFDAPLTVQSDAIMGRFGVDDGVELRLRVPDLRVAGGVVGLGPLGFGAKFGGNVNRRWAVSVIPEVAFDPEPQAPIGLLSSQVSGTFDHFSLWMHFGAKVAGAGSATTFGGGIALPVRASGVYVHAGHTFSADPFVGTGGWGRLTDTAQLDARLDLYATPGGVIPVVLAGGSLAF